VATIVDRTAGVMVAIFSGSGIIDSYKQTKANMEILIALFVFSVIAIIKTVLVYNLLK
jgi:hypothetical protein